MASFAEYSSLPEVVVTDIKPNLGYQPRVPPKSDHYYRQYTSANVIKPHSSELPLPRQTPSVLNPCCVCGGPSKAWKCVQCDDFFCDECWPKERPHRPGKVGIDGREHEKVDEDIVDRLQRIFGQPTAEEQHQRHTNDINTTWFGITKEYGQPYLHYSNRLVDILRESQIGAFTERFPQLVSFVGQTGAGKSTVIKMLIDRQQAKQVNSSDILAPVPGLVGDNVATTGDVHLYEDPGTYHAQSPFLYADCEGMTGGEHAPRGLACREKIESAKRSGKTVKNLLRKKITWADNPKMQSREYAVTSLFPRILYTFSDVVVFVLREVRTFQTEVLTQLVNWAAMSIEKSINQPSLPHVVIVVNGTDININDEQWDPMTATQGLLNDYENSVHQVPALKAILARLADAGKYITTTKGLLEEYYSSVTVVRIPTKGRYMQIDEQIGKLYEIISDRCKTSRIRKKQVRMLLNAETLPQYVNSAYDHFSTSLDEPFDFNNEALKHAPLPRNFGGHILNLILTVYNQPGHRRRHRDFFAALSRPLASCIMLAATRDSIQGSYSDLLRSTYRESLNEALHRFCDRWLPCSFTRDGETCQNVRNSHTKGHQASNGKIFARGPYETTFIVEEFFPDWINQIDKHIKDLNERLCRFDQEDNVIPRVLIDVMAQFYRVARIDGSVSNFKSNLTCLCCVRKVPENVLPCGHILCKACVQTHGNSVGQGLYHMHCCPLHPKETIWPQPARIRFKPDEAGVRILCLDGGGVRAIDEIVILQEIQKVLGHQIPVQNFFDLIVGSGTGGIIALGLGVKRWSVADCRDHFRSLCKQAFSPRIVKSLSSVSTRSRYKTKPLEKGLKSAFDQYSNLYGGSKPDHSTSIRVAVTTTVASENRPAILSNYNTESDHDSMPYKFVRPQDPEWELKTWEAARATAAAPRYFKPFVHTNTGIQYTDGAVHHVCPVFIADNERKRLWGDINQPPPDLVLSLGTGHTNCRLTHKEKRAYGQKSSALSPKIPSSPLRPSGSFSSMWRIINPIIDDQKSSEDMWNSYVAQTSTSSNEHRHVRIDIGWADKRPDFDDIEEIETIERNAINMMSDGHTVRMTAHKLVASCFYFERTGVDSRNRETGLYKCSGNIICRFDEGSRDIKGLGQILKDHIRGSSFIPFFVLEEDYGTSIMKQHDVVIPIDTIENMCYTGIFRLRSHLIIDGSHETSLTRLSLCLQPGGYSHSHPSQRSVNPSMSISGFPRELFYQDDPLSPRAAVEDDDDSEGVFELADTEGLTPNTEVPKSSMLTMFRKRSLQKSISRLSFAARSEEKVVGSGESREDSSMESSRVLLGSKKRSKSDGDGSLLDAGDGNSEGGSGKPFHGYY
ncbi:hypothetical protein FVEN_g6376 [Fusarium venenatum]|uniref:PNPLA domain-containing protein n=1 Tax=Fusarium venenatum TaxID=56646 RepID=A0A2L2SSN7_9HYPO|nr:uncharacterized protein FVRRES_04630 [Fusarium venenatum]KAG8355783.1 hypothetical protein FVEN_g6376 [Fusarium venenatum]KAH6991787.1 hypothetical protein EDB82DRAFT_565982 [Fusarium venenatum]CEI60194.1 unnamed protein product [Fusarium venenatum]